MKRRDIKCLGIALIISTLLTGCSTADIPVIGKLMNKDASTDDVASDDVNTDDGVDSSAPAVDAEYPPVPVGTVLTIDDIFGVLGQVGLSQDTVAAYAIIDEFGQSVDELYIDYDTYFTFVYQMRDDEVGTQNEMVIGVRVTDEVVSTPEVADDLGNEVETAGTEPIEEPAPTVARYEVFDFVNATSMTFDYSALEPGTLYIDNAFTFDINSIPHSYEYDSIAKNMNTLVSGYTDVDTSIADKFKVFCIPELFVYMQAPDYEEGADLSAHNGNFLLALVPQYDSYTDAIYQSEDILLLPLISDVNDFGSNISDEAKAECDFLLSEEFDDDSTDIEDFYGSMEILMQLSNTEDIFIFDDVLNVEVVDYCDMGTPDNLMDDVTWEEYEAGVISGNAQQTPTESELGEQQESGESSNSSQTVVSGTTTITETTTTTTTESVLQAINEEVANSFRSRHPELFTFFPETDLIYSKWDWRITDDTTLKGTVTLPDGTIIPPTSNRGESNIYDITTGEVSYSNEVTPVGPSVTSSSSGSVFSGSAETGASTGTETSGSSTTLGDEGYESAEPEEEEDSINEYEITSGNTTVKVTANNTYRYMIDNQNSSTSEVYINHRDKRYTIKVVNETEYMNYWTKDYLNRGMGQYSITSSNYSGVTDADGNAIILMTIEYKNGTENVKVPYMAYVRNGSEYIIIIPDEEEDANSETLADILKRCISLN